MEKIIIRNFGSLKNSEITLNKINVFIGKQASGKSVTAKLIYFFRNIVSGIFDETLNSKTKKQTDDLFIEKFESYFPSEAWPDKPFEITYYFNFKDYIKVSFKKVNLKIEYSENVMSLFDKAKEIIETRNKPSDIEDEFEVYINYEMPIRENFITFTKKSLGDIAGLRTLFVPAGRSFFSNLENNIFAFLSSNKAIDPFLVEFGSFYEFVKRRRVFKIDKNKEDKIEKNIEALLETVAEEILGGKFKQEKSKDYLIHPDKRKINLAFASSGQQETLPLLLVLRYLLKMNDSTTFIEEPEAHLFPSAQKKIVESIGLVFNNNYREANLQFIITTHSPYILSAFNNLVQASISYKKANENDKSNINKIIKKELHLRPEYISAYAFKDGKAESIIDSETQLIYGEYLDSVSCDIANEFEELLNVE